MIGVEQEAENKQQTNKQTDIQADTYTDRQRKRQAGKKQRSQANKQTNKQTSKRYIMQVTYKISSHPHGALSISRAERQCSPNLRSDFVCKNVSSRHQTYFLGLLGTCLHAFVALIVRLFTCLLVYHYYQSLICCYCSLVFFIRTFKEFKIHCACASKSKAEGV